MTLSARVGLEYRSVVNFWTARKRLMSTDSTCEAKAFYFAKNFCGYQKEKAYDAAVCVPICAAKGKVITTTCTFDCVSFVSGKSNQHLPLRPSTLVSRNARKLKTIYIYMYIIFNK